MQKHKKDGKRSGLNVLYVASRVALLLSALALPFFAPQLEQLDAIQWGGIILGLAFTLAALVCFLCRKRAYGKLQMLAWCALLIGWSGLAWQLGQDGRKGWAGALYGALVVELFWALRAGSAKPIKPLRSGQKPGVSRAYRKAQRDKEAACQVPPELEQILRDFIAETSIPRLRLTPVRGAPSAYDSKLGGIPYLPPAFTYPREHGDSAAPMRLLCQLNFGQLPHLPGFPREGILQFYIEQNDTLGLSFDAPLGEGYHVAYHSEIGPTISPPEDLREEDCFPFTGEFALEAVQDTQPMSPYDYWFDARFMEVYKRYFPDCETDRFWKLDDAQTDRIYKALDCYGDSIGGYPCFAQQDPRHDVDLSPISAPDTAAPDEASRYDTLLLQIDSEADIMWGDCGVANFFISSKMLEEKDFSDVLYNWDCH